MSDADRFLDLFQDFWDVRQNHRIRTLENSLDLAVWSQHTRTRRLHSELRHVKGTLEQRLDRLTASFDAFVELGDLRTLLVPFAPYALVRHQVHRLLADGAAARPRLDDAPADYWLTPAARGLFAALDGSVDSALRHFGIAARLDPVRAGVFAVLATATAGNRPAPDRAAPFAERFLPDLLQAPSTEIRRHERALWLTAAGGLLGAEAHDLVRRHLAAALDRYPEAERSAPVMSLLPPSPDQARSDLVNLGEVPARLDAAHRLCALRAALDRSPAAEAAPEVDSFVTAALDLLVAEGCAEEAPLVRRAEQLRRVLESSGEQSLDTEPPLWDETVGDLRELLAADVVAAEGASARGRFALGVCAPQVLAAAEDLAGKARRPLVDETSVSYRGARVVLTSRGADQDSLAAAEQRLERVFLSDPPMTVVWWSLGVAAGAVLLALVTGWFPLFLPVAVVAGVVGGWRYVDVRAEQAEQRNAVDADLASLHSRVKAGVREWRSLHDRVARAAEDAERDLAAVRERLARL
ncbi:MAG TPA: hypothetical protein VKZ89_13980 [Thermobifida alba]|nr:hypothetical protein [Thermobifida alba]